jgi:hypothetical protein
MSGNKLEEGVKSPMGKFLFSLRRPNFLWAYLTSYPSPGTIFIGAKWPGIKLNTICYQVLSGRMIRNKIKFAILIQVE